MFPTGVVKLATYLTQTQKSDVVTTQETMTRPVPTVAHPSSGFLRRREPHSQGDDRGDEQQGPSRPRTPPLTTSSPAQNRHAPAVVASRTAVAIRSGHGRLSSTSWILLQRQRDEGDEPLEGDRRRVGQKVVLD